LFSSQQQSVKISVVQNRQGIAKFCNDVVLSTLEAQWGICRGTSQNSHSTICHIHNPKTQSMVRMKTTSHSSGCQHQKNGTPGWNHCQNVTSMSSASVDRSPTCFKHGLHASLDLSFDHPMTMLIPQKCQLWKQRRNKHEKGTMHWLCERICCRFDHVATVATAHDTSSCPAAMPAMLCAILAWKCIDMVSFNSCWKASSSRKTPCTESNNHLADITSTCKLRSFWTCLPTLAHPGLASLSPLQLLTPATCCSSWPMRIRIASCQMLNVQMLGSCATRHSSHVTWWLCWTKMEQLWFPLV